MGGLENSAPARIARALFLTLACICFAVMALTVGLQVLGRYVLDFPIAMFAEIATYAQVWLGVLGAGWAVRCGTVFAIDSLVAPLPLALRRLVLAVNTGLGIGFILVVFYGSLFLIEIGEFQTSPSLGIPMWIIYLVMPVGMTYFALEILLKALAEWRAPYRSGHGQPVVD